MISSSTFLFVLVQELSSKDFSVLLTQVNSNSSGIYLRKVMTLSKHSGGDSSAQLSAVSTQSQRLVAYNKPEGTTSPVFSDILINMKLEMCITVLQIIKYCVGLN